MNLALVGATGVVGEQILEQLDARSFPVGELRLFASEDSVGDVVDFAGESQLLRPLDENAFTEIDLAIFATPVAVSRQWLPVAARAGALCIDLSSAERLSDERALVVAGVNEDVIDGAVFTTPASLVVQLARLLNSLRVSESLVALQVTAVLPASAAGRPGFDELQKQAGDLLNGRPAHEAIFPGRLAFNCLPVSGSVSDVVADELRKVLQLPAQLRLRVQQLMAPLFFGEAAFVCLEFAREADPEAIREAIERAEELRLVADIQDATPNDAIGQDEILVHLIDSPSGAADRIELWIAADNAGSGAAGNVVRLAESLVKKLQH